MHIIVKSPLLHKTLQCYLREHIVSMEECDFVISDSILDNLTKPICLISFSEDSDIRRPLYRQSLFSDLEIFNKQLQSMESLSNQPLNSVLDLKELAMLKDSIDLINGKINDKKSNDIKQEIENIVQDFANRLYEVISNAK